MASQTKHPIRIPVQIGLRVEYRFMVIEISVVSLPII